MRFKILCLILIALISCLNGLDENAGTSGFSFLKVNYSARPAAMGNAFTGLANDASAVFFNPSGLVQINKPELQATYMNYMDGINCGSVVYVHPLSSRFVIAGFAQFLTAKETRTLADASGNYIGTAGEFGVSDFLAGISISRYILDILDIGINVKYIQESLDDNVASALAFDISFIHQTTNKDLKVGFSFKNLGTQLTYYTESKYEEKLPSVMTVGFNYHPQERLYLLLDINKPLDLDFAGRVGAEYMLYENLFLRGGYRSEASNWKAGGDLDLFAGMSLGLGFTFRSYKIDYAINSYGDLGFMNQITLGYSF
jgi:hypothetical protein